MTPMHFQYLLGLCCLRCHPDAISMTLGNRVRDAASGTERDVDVTIELTEPDGQRTAFIGYEAKMEQDSLDVSQVEQLCAKLNDMPDLTTRAIVSAKGFTAPAVRKTERHGVRLFEFREWKESVKDGFPETSLEGPAAESLAFGSTEFAWVGPPVLVGVNPDDTDRAGYVPFLADDSPLFEEDGTPHPQHPTLRAFFSSLLAFLSRRLCHSPESQRLLMAPIPYPPHERPDGPIGDPIPFPQVLCRIEYGVYFSHEGTLRRIRSVMVSGNLQWQYARVRGEYRVLVDVASQQIYAGAAVVSHPQRPGVLIAGTLAADSPLMNLRVIQLSEKQQNFLHRLEVRA